MMKPVALLLSAALLAACNPEIAGTETPSMASSGLENAGPADTAPPPLPDTRAVQRLEDVDFNAYSQDLARFVGFERGEARIDAIDKVRLYFAPQDSEIVQTSTKAFDRPDGSVMIFSVSGLKDDSVKAQEIFLILSGPKEGQQTLAEYGMRIKCWRGENTENWQADLCP